MDIDWNDYDLVAFDVTALYPSLVVKSSDPKALLPNVSMMIRDFFETQYAEWLVRALSLLFGESISMHQRRK